MTPKTSHDECTNLILPAGFCSDYLHFHVCVSPKSTGCGPLGLVLLSSTKLIDIRAGIMFEVPSGSVKAGPLEKSGCCQLGKFGHSHKDFLALYNTALARTAQFWLLVLVVQVPRHSNKGRACFFFFTIIQVSIMQCTVFLPIFN